MLFYTSTCTCSGKHVIVHVRYLSTPDEQANHHLSIRRRPVHVHVVVYILLYI